MKEIKPEPEITMEVFNTTKSKFKDDVQPAIKQPLTKGQRNLMNARIEHSLISNAVIVFQIYRVTQNFDNDGNRIIETQEAYYNTSLSEKSTSIPMIKPYAEEKVLMFNKHLDSYTQNGSGWIFDKILRLRI
jgi:hypothetical protein